MNADERGSQRAIEWESLGHFRAVVQGQLWGLEFLHCQNSRRAAFLVEAGNFTMGWFAISTHRNPPAEGE